MLRDLYIGGVLIRCWYTLAIQENIHELRSGRRAVDLFHVQFKEL